MPKKTSIKQDFIEAKSEYFETYNDDKPLFKTDPNKPINKPLAYFKIALGLFAVYVCVWLFIL